MCEHWHTNTCMNKCIGQCKYACMCMLHARACMCTCLHTEQHAFVYQRWQFAPHVSLRRVHARVCVHASMHECVEAGRVRAHQSFFGTCSPACVHVRAGAPYLPCANACAWNAMHTARPCQRRWVAKVGHIGSISALPTACPLRGYRRAGTQNDRLSEAVI